MAAPKLRIVFYEDGNEIHSYYYLERSEGLRAIEILKILPKIRKWIPVSELAKRININPTVLLMTIIKLSGAKYIDLELNGKRKVIAKSPVIIIKKNYSRRNPRHRFLRPAVYVKKGHS